MQQDVQRTKGHQGPQTLQWLMQSLTESISQLHALHLYYLLQNPTEHELVQLCAYVDQAVLPGFQRIQEMEEMQTRRRDLMSLADVVRQHQVLLLLQIMHLHALGDMCNEVRQLAAQRDTEGLQSCELLEHYQSLRPLQDAVQRWSQRRCTMASHGITASDIATSATAVVVEPVLVTWVAMCEVVEQLRAQVREQLGGAETPLDRLHVAGLAELGDAIHVSDERRAQLQEHVNLTEHAALPVDFWPFMRMLVGLDIFRSGTTSTGAGGQSLLFEDAALHAANAGGIGVDFTTTGVLKECLSSVTFFALNAILEGFDMGNVFHDNFADVVEITCACVRHLPANLVGSLTEGLARYCPEGSVAPARPSEAAGTDAGAHVAALLQHALDVFPVYVYPLPRALASLGRAAARAGNGDACGMIYDILCTMDGFAMASSVKREGSDWDVVSLAEAQEVAPDFVRDTDRTYVRACRDIVLTHSSLSITVPRGSVGVVVAQPLVGAEVVDHDAQDTLLLRWNVHYSGWFFLAQLLQVPEIPTAHEKAGQVDSLQASIIDVLSVMAFYHDLECELSAHLNDIYAQLGRPHERHLLLDKAIRQVFVVLVTFLRRELGFWKCALWTDWLIF
jgi:hypothetical protein